MFEDNILFGKFLYRMAQFVGAFYAVDPKDAGGNAKKDKQPSPPGKPATTTIPTTKTSTMTTTSSGGALKVQVEPTTPGTYTLATTTITTTMVMYRTYE